MAEKSKLQKTLEEISKKFKDESIRILGDEIIPTMDVISTGSLSIDKALGVGGLPKGRIIEIFGPESSGKTTVCLHVIAQAQKKLPEKACAIIDTEHALDMNYAKNLGVDVEKLVLSQPDYGEQALGVCEALIESDEFSVIVIDSVAALTPKAEIDGEMGTAVIGLHARLMSQALRKLTAKVASSKTILIFTNQLREKIGVMFGSPEVTTGGKALKFYASIRLDIRRKDQIKNGEDVIGNLTKVKIVKNKVAPPFKEALFNIIYNEGISSIDEIIDFSIENKSIVKAGAWYKLNDEKFQGLSNVKDYIKNNPNVFEDLKKKIYGEANIPT